MGEVCWEGREEGESGWRVGGQENFRDELEREAKV